MSVIYRKLVLPPLRRALIDFAGQINATHDLTLNFHDDYRPDTAVSRLTSWYRQLQERLFGRRWYQLPREQLIEFVAFPEFSKAGHPHYHCAARIPVSHFGYFQRIAQKRWKAHVPTGTLYLQPIEQDPENFARVFSYITKSSTSRDVIHSSMLLPIT